MTVDDHAEALYGGDPASFVARRDDLVRQLRSAGDRDMAAAVKALRRPTAAAAVLNRIARDEPELITATLTAAEHLTRTQRRALSGLPDADVRGAVRAHHAAIAAVLAAAGPQAVAVTDAMRATLLTAAVDGDVADGLQRGVLAVTATQGDPSAALLGSAPLTAVSPRPKLTVVEDPEDEEDLQDEEAQDDESPGGDPGGQAGRAAARARAQAAAARKAAAATVVSTERALGAARAEQVATARRRRAADSAADAAAKGVTAARAVIARLREELARAEAALQSALTEAEGTQQALDEATARDDAAARRTNQAEEALREAHHDLDALGDAP